MERRTSSSRGREAVDTFEALAARLRAGRAARSRQGTPRQLSRPSTSLAERWTTVEASRKLREGGVGGRKQRALVDGAAAAVMLQSWLDGASRRRR